MTTDKELLMWKGKAAEAEQKRVAAENRAMKLSGQLDSARKALGEAAAIFAKLTKADIYDNKGYLTGREGRFKFAKTEFVYAKNMMSGARANIEPGMEIGVTLKKNEEIKATDPPPNPKTDDWFMDRNNVLHWYYLGKWHPPLEGEDE